jgi:hypothetical protein
MLRLWHEAWAGLQSEIENTEKAMRFRQRRVKVQLKYMIFKWRKELKEQTKVIEG